MRFFLLPRVTACVAHGLLSAVLLTSAPGQRNDERYTIQTIAGLAGVSGSSNGSGTAARFARPYGIARDYAGNLYVADSFNHIIRKITPAGSVSLMAGAAGTAGSADGNATAARFNFPYAVAVDGAQNLYVCDTENHTIRKITASGFVSTLAGLAGAPGSADGTGSAARFNFPNGVAVDGAANVYVADTYNHTVRKITPAGVVSTWAGLAGQAGASDGTGEAARFAYPFGVAADGSGNVYVADTYNYTIRKITSERLVSTLAGLPAEAGTADGVGNNARFNAPRGIAVDGRGNVYIADENNHTIRKLNPTQSVSTLAGLAGTLGGADGVGGAARFSFAAGIAVNSAGAIFIADTQNHTIRRGAAPPKEAAVDATFNAGDFTNGLVNAAVLQPDGKVLIAGIFNKVHGVVCHNLARLHADGTLDSTFDPGEGPDYGIERGGLILQEDGKLLITGNFEYVNGVPRAAGIARLHGDGTLDLAFDPGRTISFDGADDGNGNATFPGRVARMTSQADGKLVVAGRFRFVITGPGQSVVRSGVTRFTADGLFDPSFDPGAGLSSKFDPSNQSLLIKGAAIQRLGANSGKILLLGSFDSFDGHTVPGVVRLNSNGSFDKSFALGAEANSYALSGLFLQADDRVLLTGLSRLDDSGRMIRTGVNGEFDAGFVPEEFLTGNYGEVFSVVQQADGKLLVGGAFHRVGGITANNIVRLETNGLRDATFSGSGGGLSGFQVNALLLHPSNGKIFAGGYFSTFGNAVRNNVAWMGSDGVVDGTFDGLAGVADYQPQIYALAVQPDGKILAGGVFSVLNGVPHYNLVRLNPDATLDPTFSSTLGTEGSVRTILLQPDGKILIGGNVRMVNGIARGGVARLNSDGTLDLGFNAGKGFDNLVSALEQDSAGNVFVGGAFLKFNGGARKYLVKLNANGELIEAFAPEPAHPRLWMHSLSMKQMTVSSSPGAFQDIITLRQDASPASVQRQPHLIQRLTAAAPASPAPSEL